MSSHGERHPSEEQVHDADPAGSESDSDEEDLQDRFGPLLSIDHASLIALASKIRTQEEGEHTSANSTVTLLSGSYNLVYIIHFPDGIKYVIRVPATGWGTRFDATAREAFVSTALTMRYIANNTQIPMPKVYEFDPATENGIKAPYVAMSYIPGQTVSSIWLKKEVGPRSPVGIRARILETVAQAAIQLEQLRFDQIGSLQFQPGGKISVGPYFDFDEGNLGDEDYGKYLRINSDGPFRSSSAYLNDILQGSSYSKDGNPVDLGIEKITAKAISYLPASQSQPETFALMIPDFDSQNIMVDEDGTLTGIIDWDNVQTEPECFGPCRYPSWITRDWDPAMYGYPRYEEDSPEQLAEYRRFYHAQIEKTRRCRNLDIAIKSHLFEAVVISAGSKLCRLEIVRKFVGQILDIDHEKALIFVIHLGCDELDEKAIEQFEEKLKAFLKV